MAQTNDVERRAAEMAAQFTVDTVALQRADEATAKASEALARAAEAERVMTLQYKNLEGKVAEQGADLKESRVEMRTGFSDVQKTLAGSIDQQRKLLDDKFQEHRRAEESRLQEQRRKADTWMRWGLSILATVCVGMVGYIWRMKVGG
jgi:hypothetical protein